MKGGVDAGLVREVSRSFALSLNLLPGPMREPVSLAYLLARASDTLADTVGVATDERLALLAGMSGELSGGDATWRRDLSQFVARQDHAGERALMQNIGDCFDMLDALPSRQAELVREVLAIITGGQRLDLERFGQTGVALESADLLDDYCWRVAGCVGAFWTRIGFETLGERFSRAEPAELEKWGVNFGKGLQLVNVLRDVPADRAAGRCYLPVEDPGDPRQLMAEAVSWRTRAREGMAAGRRYARALRMRRLRAATVLPAWIGEKTLDLLDGADWKSLERGVKVDRRTVRRCVWKALFF